MRVPERLAPLLSGFVPTGQPDVVDGAVTTTLHLADPRGVKRLAGRFGGAMEVREPGIARSATRDWAASGLALYRRPDAEH